MERPHRPRPARAGFTLIELLVAILIIAALIALLVPTIAAAFRKAKEAQVSAEMNNLATALASFKNTYGDYPPSRVLLCEQGYLDFLSGTATGGVTVTSMIASDNDSNTSDMTYAQLAQRSLTYMRRFWPRCNFTGNPYTSSSNHSAQLSTLPGQFNDFNGDGVVDPNNHIILNGSECLTFFLGGIPILSGNMVLGVGGFSKSPTFPFVLNGAYGNTIIAPNRTVPNYDFNNGRLVDQDHDLIPSYIDPIDTSIGNRRSYAYFSAYGTNAYDPNDVNGYGRANDYATTGTLNDSGDYEQEEIGASTTPVFVERGFTVSFPPGSVVSPAPNPYTSGPPVTTSGQTWINANSFQLICAGQDRNWGLGGTYSQNNTGSAGTLPIYPTATDAGNVNGDTDRIREYDNLTNFAGGRLQ